MFKKTTKLHLTTPHPTPALITGFQAQLTANRVTEKKEMGFSRSLTAVPGERNKGICPFGAVHLWSESTFVENKWWSRLRQPLQYIK